MHLLLAIGLKTKLTKWKRIKLKATEITCECECVYEYVPRADLCKNPRAKHRSGICYTNQLVDHA